MKSDVVGYALVDAAKAPKYESITDDCSFAAHDSPRLSDRPENVCEERLLVQHAGETLHQRTQPGFRHHGD
jgi:hypothetical protein